MTRTSGSFLKANPEALAKDLRTSNDFASNLESRQDSSFSIATDRVLSSAVHLELLTGKLRDLYASSIS